MLKEWKMKQHLDATYRNLLRLCCKGGDRRSTEAICTVLKAMAHERYVRIMYT